MKARTNRFTVKERWVSGLLTFLALGIIAVMALVLPNRTIGANSVDCSGDWSSSPDPVLRDACSRRKATQVAVELQHAQATSEAMPVRPTDLPSGLAPLLPMPDYVKPVMEMKFDPFDGPPPSHWKGYTSVWLDGGVPNADYTYWSKLYVLARSGHHDTADIDPSALPTRSDGDLYPTLNTDILDGGGPGEERYLKLWTCPQPIGDIVITNITNPPVNITDASTPFPGLQSVVYFQGKAGQTGSFNMATETWNFDPVLK